MKVSGFTFIRNAVRYDFPIIEAITSVLPIVDEFVVNVGHSEDDTLGLIRSIGSHKIRIIETQWDENLRTGGKIFGMQQDIALSHCTGDWALLVQGDEVVHEEDYTEIQNAMDRYLRQPEVLGLVFRMVHFKGDYWSIDPWMYRKATRIVRNHCGIHSATDGCDFLPKDKDQMIKSGPHGRLIKARMFHYGWVKDPKALQQKLQQKFHVGNAPLDYVKDLRLNRREGERMSMQKSVLEAAIRSEYPTYDILKSYRGTHPQGMKSRIASKTTLRPRRNRWLNPKFYKEIFTHGFKG